MLDVRSGSSVARNSSSIAALGDLLLPDENGDRGGAGNTALTADRRILVVDDSSCQQLTLKAMLRKRGFVVDAAKSVQDALDRIQRRPYDIVISDWIMPGRSGLDLCREVKGSDLGSRTYFILSSSKNEKRDIADGLDAGADDFVTKPVNECELLARIRAGCRTLKLQEDIAERNRGLEAANSKLQFANDTINSDLRIAARMQNTLVPEKHSRFAGAEIAASYLPCAHLGGDLIGYFGRPTQYVAAYSIDVSGHGIPAALLSTVLSQALSGVHWAANIAFRSTALGQPELLDPCETASGLNTRFQDWGHANQYFTMALVKLDPVTGKGLLCQAGHPAPAIVRSGGGIEFLGDGGMPIGMLADATFESIPFELSKGDTLVLYSDGVTEAELPCGQLLGEDGLAKILDNLRDYPLEHYGDEVIRRASVATKRPNFNDDVSVLALRL